MQRKTTIPGKKRESFDVEQHPWSLIGIVPQGGPDRAIESNRETTVVLKSCLQSGFSSCGFAIVVVEHASQPLTTLDSSDRFCRCLQRNDQPIAEPLVIALSVIVLNEFADRFAQRVFTKKDHPFQTAFFDRSDKSFRVRVQIG